MIFLRINLPNFGSLTSINANHHLVERYCVTVPPILMPFGVTAFPQKIFGETAFPLNYTTVYSLVI